MTTSQHQFFYIGSYSDTHIKMGITTRLLGHRKSEYMTGGNWRYVTVFKFNCKKHELLYVEKCALAATLSYVPQEHFNREWRECDNDTTIPDLVEMIKESIPPDLEYTIVDPSEYSLKNNTSSPESIAVQPHFTSWINAHNFKLHINSVRLARQAKQLEQKTRSDGKTTFLQEFLPNNSFRDIQSELYDKLYDIIASNKPYRGVIQWATGVGKTIAFMIGTVLSVRHCNKQNKIFRGLFVAPENSILETMKGRETLSSKYGITIINGSGGRLSKLKIPENKHILILTTHHSLTKAKNWSKIPKLDLLHYDEVHCITGPKFKKALEQNLSRINPVLFTGTSATPLTANAYQKQLFNKIFQDIYLSKCSINAAVKLGYIAAPKFSVNVIRAKSTKHQLEAFTKSIDINIQQKILEDGRCDKVIAYIPSRHGLMTPTECVKYAAKYVKKFISNKYIIYLQDNSDGLSDLDFIKAKPNNKTHVLFACQKYRTGADIRDLDLVAVLMGGRMAWHNLIQISGRALRLDYVGKKGWCCISKIGDESTTADDVFSTIFKELLGYFNISKTDSQSTIMQKVKDFFGTLIINTTQLTLEQTMTKINEMHNPPNQKPKSRLDEVREYLAECEKFVETHHKSPLKDEQKSEREITLANQIAHFRKNRNIYDDGKGKEWGTFKNEQYRNECLDFLRTIDYVILTINSEALEKLSDKNIKTKLLKLKKHLPNITHNITRESICTIEELTIYKNAGYIKFSQTEK